MCPIFTGKTWDTTYSTEYFPHITEYISLGKYIVTAHQVPHVSSCPGSTGYLIWAKRGNVVVSYLEVTQSGTDGTSSYRCE